MDVNEAIKTRKSIREFKPDPVSRQVLAEILETATRAPSALNTQPWEFVVVAGEEMKRLREANVAMFDSKVEPHAELTVTGPFAGVYRERQVRLAVQLYGLMGIAREDKGRRAEWSRQGFQFFHAPAAIIIMHDKSLGETQALLDLGAVMQNIALAALSYELGTCIQDQGVMYPDVVRTLMNIPETKRLAICLSIGYPDWSHPANRIFSEREPLDNVTTWRGI